ncbi:MAG: hypothetical protein ABIS50_22350 [Luteolibacter sp.]|uniref:hypothetical protein n=1 Tax=Luteolibacter sp. TaxID=1962973 RepID=UPI003266D266
MQSRIAALTMMVVLALAPAGFAGGKKEHKASITFHMETAATDNPKMTFTQMANGKMRTFLRSPEISINDVASFVPFPSDVGDGYGLVLTLKGGAVTRLAAITNNNAGSWMIVQVNGRVVDGVMIDKEVSDGRMVIWKGVTLADVTLLDSELPRTGQEGKKKK